MGETTMADSGRRGSAWRIAAWSAAGLVLAIPLVAMQFGAEAAWTASDFAVAGALFPGVGIPYDPATGRSRDTAYRAGADTALATALLLVWMTLAEGLIGAEGDPFDVVYGAPLLVPVLVAVVSRARPKGMAVAMFAAAAAQAFVAGLGLLLGKQHSEVGSVSGILALNGFFVLLWVGSAMLFRAAVREAPRRVKALRAHAILSLLLMATGVEFSAFMIQVEDDPPGIPLLLLATGTAWLLVTRSRMRRLIHREEPAASKPSA